ncbi:phage portal protein [Planococcus sp. S3-L1]|uniref:phage portal protein n=1 Tax=Planococcus sp. S3-L1 TaxID=3046200 RepID=UPI0024B9E5D3|nr:phage portal protein [Planococcus sp. S3-L1]MDJ0331720.1 phage portal protein [Planococcus sp. S3-L1]
MNLEEYKKVKYKNDEHWFVEEVNTVQNQQRLMNVEEKKDYLMGHHNIKKLPSFMYNGELITPRKIVLSTAKTLLQFHTQFLLKNDVQLTGNEKMVDELGKVNKLGKYNAKNLKILSNLLKFGSCAEYVYVNKKGYIDSKILAADEITPVYNHHNELISFVQSYVHDAISYYTVYEEDVVKEYTNEGGKIHLTGQHANLSGLPIHYRSHNEYSEIEGSSVLDDFINILDNMELLLSRTVDNTFLYSAGIPVVVGQRLTNGGIPKEIAGMGIHLEDGSSFSFESNDVDIKAFEALYSQLNQSLLDIAAVPAVSMNKSDVSNLSEVSIKMLFSLAEVKASENEGYLRDGLYERYDKIRKLLSYRGVTITDDQYASLELLFTYNRPSNESERVADLVDLRAINAISMESVLEHSPYTTDVTQEMERIKAEEASKPLAVDVAKQVNEVKEVEGMNALVD